MDKRILIVLALIPITFAFNSCSFQKKPEYDISGFNWLIGSRLDTINGFFESWSIQGDSIFTGFGYSVATSDTIFRERLVIRKIHNKWNYCVNFRNELSNFVLINSPGDSLVFDNPGNDFPKRITYIRELNGKIAASVENPGEPDKTINYYFIPPN
ncbi:MAG: hypothetical protein H6541_12690 [Lentimicrobiaceae bacterium]|nr:hypothetical protein [Lentimicrobiaceae bacterium]